VDWEAHTKALKRRRDLALGAGTDLFYDTPLEIVRGEGIHLFDHCGRRYVDMYNNVPCVGHGNRAVARAMAAQQATLNVHNRYLHEGIVAFAERLASLHHGGIESVVFSCSGTEANEVALRMARAVTGQRGIVCTDAAYHGSSGLVDALTGVGTHPGDTSDIQGFPFPDCYRPLVNGLDEESLGSAYLEEIARAIHRLREAGHGFAGLIVCPILANEGLPRIPDGLMARITDLVHREGGLMISDEVQSGYGRTGHWWGYEYEGFVPDIAVSGKPMGNGLPLAATAASRAHVNAFRAASGYFNTFASTPLQAAVGMTVLDEIERLGLLQSASDVGAWLLGELVTRQTEHACMGDVRGCGLFISVELVKNPDSREPDAALADRLVNLLKEEGFLLSNAGAYDNVIKIRPPLVFSQREAEEFLPAFDRCMSLINA
jgi:4-aminobutyrate aminotransferase-like enzyme